MSIKVKVCLLFASFTVLSCTSEKLGDTELATEEKAFEQVRRIEFEPLFKRTVATKVIEIEGEPHYAFHDGGELSINVFNMQGQVKWQLQLPTIDAPNGLNRISDFYWQSSDSIYVFDGQYNRIVLTGVGIEPYRLWDSNSGAIGSSLNGLIIEVYKKDCESIMDLVQFVSTNYKSSKDFYEYSHQAVRYNLTKAEYSSGIPYPPESPYREYLFWNGSQPYVTRFKDEYLVVFPFDKDLHVYDAEMNYRYAVDSEPKNFPKAVANQFQTRQQDDIVRIHFKLNGFNLRTHSVFEYDGRFLFGKVYRAPAGADSDLPEDMMAFQISGYKPKFYLQLFELTGGKWAKLGDDLLVPEESSNLMAVDAEGHYHFWGKDASRETEFVNIYQLLKSQSNEAFLVEKSR